MWLPESSAQLNQAPFSDLHIYLQPHIWLKKKKKKQNWLAEAVILETSHPAASTIVYMLLVKMSASTPKASSGVLTKMTPP